MTDSTSDFDSVLNALTTRQHLAPHEPIHEAIAHLVGGVGVCNVAAQQALVWLQLDPARSIGRLRRTEILQLARTVHRMWRSRTSDAATASQSQG